MDDKLRIGNLLRAFQTIIDRGERSESGHQFNGVNATSDVDGYTLVLSDATVSATVFFHNKLHIETPNRRATDAFLKKISAIVAS